MEILYRYVIVYTDPVYDRTNIGFTDDMDVAIRKANEYRKKGCDVYITQTVAHFNAE